ncbi:MAG TPA: hypothetical protein DDW96_03495 [Synergistaceae bacterium]|nr:MAG: Uncharacterized protein XD83_0129 [Synergistales bacterium 57_84]KUK89076.1 MAG: Uncharacterized protein XE01_0017 [Synergistales bacterium 58_81]HBG14380.1 hypothetical protein [Synergistaceae bacterium]HCP07474.1 hypothetical protein [Synergistaceae bacterium]
MAEKKQSPLLDDVRVFAFVGSAGTGKSQRAQLVALELGVDFIIDDGLLIRKGQIVRGKSAKTEKNQVRAIRRALFEYPDHRRAVVEYLSLSQPCSVMIIATSSGMVSRILANLGLPEPEKIIRIEEVSSPEEISRAKKERSFKGQHVIPVSHIQVRKHFAGKLVGRLKVLFDNSDSMEGEKTIVRPPFKFFGEVSIDPEAISQMARFIAERTSQVSSVVSVQTRPANEGIAIHMELGYRPGQRSMVLLGDSLRERISKAVAGITGLDVLRVDISFVGVEI